MFEFLKSLNNIAEDDIEIMPGSGISLKNIKIFRDAGFTSAHLSASGPEDEYVDSMTEVHFGVREAFSDETTIKKIVAIAK